MFVYTDNVQHTYKQYMYFETSTLSRCEEVEYEQEIYPGKFSKKRKGKEEKKEKKTKKKENENQIQEKENKIQNIKEGKTEL